MKDSDAFLFLLDNWGLRVNGNEKRLDGASPGPKKKNESAKAKGMA